MICRLGERVSRSRTRGPARVRDCHERLAEFTTAGGLCRRRSALGRSGRFARGWESDCEQERGILESEDFMHHGLAQHEQLADPEVVSVVRSDDA